MTVSYTELACSLDEDIEYDATPPKVLEQLNVLAARVAKYKSDEPGEYQQVGPVIRWSTDNHRARWKATTTLYRAPTTLVTSTQPQAPEVSITATHDVGHAKVVSTTPGKTELAPQVTSHT